jgi:exopolyphosphatase/pppGpp-phosphohydrolase
MDVTRSWPVRAAIDVGSNTIHVVVARCSPMKLDILADELEMVRIGESVTATGAISPEKSQQALRVMRDYQEIARRYGALEIMTVATEAIRQANNHAEFLAMVYAETGLTIHLISGEAEAGLTFWGATCEIPSLANAAEAEDVGVLDLGGGSMEVVFAHQMQIVWRTSIPVGSGWLYDRYLSGDPPTPQEIVAARTFLHTSLAEQTLPTAPSQLIATGGSANSLLRLVQQAFHRAPTYHSLSLNDLARCQGLLSALEASDVANLYGQPLARARVLLAGALIIQEMMQLLHLSEIQVSSHGLREGALLARERYGDRWLAEAEQASFADESFAQSAQRVLQERLEAFLEWPAEVLKQKNNEAVHKMRVASRRLRAALDAYESCCDPLLYAKIYRQVKQIADALGEARDADVQLQYLHAQLDGLHADERAGIRWLIAQLREHRQQKQQELQTLLRRLDGKKCARWLKESLERKKQ